MEDSQEKVVKEERPHWMLEELKAGHTGNRKSERLRRRGDESEKNRASEGGKCPERHG